MAQRDERPKITLVADNFNDIITDIKCFQHRCNHCGRVTLKHTVRTLQHLNQCNVFQQHEKKKKECLRPR